MLGLLAGCAAGPSRLEQALLADHNPASHGGDLSTRYVVRCPDVLAVDVAGPAPWNARRPVGPDGRLDLGAVRPHVDGLTAPEAAAAVARQLGLPPDQVRVRVAEFNSQHLYLYGAVTGLERAVPYRGPETVLELLQRAGGLTPGAASGDIQVVRAHVADGKTPEVFHVDLQAILRQQDQHTNVRLQPFDQIFIGQTRRSSLTPSIPPWLRPVYKKLVGMSRPAQSGG